MVYAQCDDQVQRGISELDVSVGKELPCRSFPELTILWAWLDGCRVKAERLRCRGRLPRPCAFAEDCYRQHDREAVQERGKVGILDEQDDPHVDRVKLRGEDQTPHHHLQERLQHQPAEV